MKIGAIYVNGCRAADNPYAAGLYIGRGELLFPDGRREKHETRRRHVRHLVKASRTWGFEDLRSACRRAVEEMHEAAAAYFHEVVWPLEFDEETRARVCRKEYTPPSFEEWAMSRNVTEPSRVVTDGHEVSGDAGA